MALDMYRFITPYHGPTDPNGAVSNAVNAMGHLGSLQRQDSAQAEQKREFDVREKRQEGENGWEHQKDVSGALRRYASVLATNPEAAAAFEGQLRALGVQFHPVEAPQPSPLPDTQQPEPEAPVDTAPPAEEPKPTNKDIPPLLAKEMASQGRAPDVTEASPPEEVQQGLRASLGPMPGMGPLARAQPEPPPEPAAIGPEKQAADIALKASGVQPRLPKFRASWNGQDLGEYDPEALRSSQRGAAEDLASGLVAGTNEKDRPLVEEQFKGARNPKDVESITKSFTIPQMAITHSDTRQAMKSANKGRGHGGGLDDKSAARLDTEIRGWVTTHANLGDVKRLAQVANETGKALTLISSPDALANKVAVAQQIKALFGAAASEGERAFVLGAKGVADRLMMEVDNWVGGGELPPDFKTSVNQLAGMLHDAAKDQAKHVAEVASDSILNDPLVGGRLPQSYKKGVGEHIRAAITAESGIQPDSERAAPNKPGQRPGRPAFLGEP